MLLGTCKNSLLVVFVVLVGSFFPVFAVSLQEKLGANSQALAQMNSVFAQGTRGSDLFATSLKLIKTNEVKVAYDALAEIYDLYPEFVSCRIEKKDIINVLYDANLDFRLTLDQTLNDKLTKDVSVPSASQIASSYKRIIGCRYSGVVADPNIYQSIRTKINTKYAAYYTNLHQNSTYTWDGIAEDMFVNGSLDDSDYDLLIDIDKVGQKFFQGFTSSPATLLYKFPTLPLANNNGGGGDQGGGGLDAGGGAGPLGGGISPNGSSLSGSTGSSTLGGITPRVSTITTAITHFIEQNDTPVATPNDLYALPSNTCLSGVPADVPPAYQVTTDPDIYQTWIESQYTGFTYTPGLDYVPSNTSSDSSDSTSQDAYITHALDSGVGGTCGESCATLSSIDQQNCQAQCAQSCGQTCDVNLTAEKQSCKDTYTATQKHCASVGFGDPLCYPNAASDYASCKLSADFHHSVCTINCHCFMIGGPKGTGWRAMDMEDMYRIKFCVVPVQITPPGGGKRVYSVEEIFNEYKNIFGALLNGGDMNKRVKKSSSEYFDISLEDVNFADLFTFQVVTKIVPLFSKISSSTMKKERKELLDNFESALLGTEPDSNNKYVVVSDVPWTKAQSENVQTLAQMDAKISEIASLEKDMQTYAPNLIKDSLNVKPAGINDTVATFLEYNGKFWDQTAIILKTMANEASLLKTTIESKG